MNSYTMEKTSEVAKQASRDIEKFLLERPETISVVNVEGLKEYQKKDVDLIWTYKYKNKTHVKKIEIKGDRYSHTGNYFIETISNLELNNEGCFMYTEADYIFYYFIEIKELNVFPMIKTRKWFFENEGRFVEKRLQTNVYDDKYYTTLGKLVPKKVLSSEVKGIKKINIDYLIN